MRVLFPGVYSISLKIFLLAIKIARSDWDWGWKWDLKAIDIVDQIAAFKRDTSEFEFKG